MLKQLQRLLELSPPVPYTCTGHNAFQTNDDLLPCCCCPATSTRILLFLRCCTTHAKTIQDIQQTMQMELKKKKTSILRCMVANKHPCFNHYNSQNRKSLVCGLELLSFLCTLWIKSYCVTIQIKVMTGVSLSFDSPGTLVFIPVTKMLLRM